MPLFFNILSGELAGKSIEIKDGLTIGRKIGDLILNDPRVSALHAIVKKTKKSQFVIFDNKSANGIKINKKIHTKFLLEKNQILTIGDTKLRVVEINNEQIKLQNEWEKILANVLLNKNLKCQNIPKKIIPFNPALKLTFLEGIQTNETFVLGYGPRIIGTTSLDILIYEPNAPDNCFTLEPIENNKILFRTEHPSQVLLNKTETSTEEIKNKDLIYIGFTTIQIYFLDKFPITHV